MLNKATGVWSWQDYDARLSDRSTYTPGPDHIRVRVGNSGRDPRTLSRTRNQIGPIGMPYSSYITANGPVTVGDIFIDNRLVRE